MKLSPFLGHAVFTRPTRAKTSAPLARGGGETWRRRRVKIWPRGVRRLTAGSSPDRELSPVHVRRSEPRSTIVIPGHAAGFSRSIRARPDPDTLDSSSATHPLTLAEGQGAELQAAAGFESSGCVCLTLLYNTDVSSCVCVCACVLLLLLLKTLTYAPASFELSSCIHLGEKPAESVFNAEEADWMNPVRHISVDQSDLRYVARLLEPEASYGSEGQHWFRKMKSKRFFVSLITSATESCRYVRYMLLYRISGYDVIMFAA